MIVPAFRFLYSEAKVARDPTSNPRYASSTVRPSQSTIFAIPTRPPSGLSTVTQVCSFLLSTAKVEITRAFRDL